MLINPSQLNDLLIDICVIGAGPAGIIFTLEYAKKNPKLNILLVECGDKKTTDNPLDDTITVLNLVNHLPPYECTNKGLGGSTITWGGRCVEYNEIDFMPHGAVNQHCTWNPEFYNSVKPHYQVSAEYFQCGDAVFDTSEMEEVEKNSCIAENFIDGPVTDKYIERWSLPTRFGNVYRDELKQNKNIYILEGFYIEAFSELNHDGNVVSAKAISIDSSDTFSISAKRFVISAGGQESTRLLLKSPQLFAELKGIPTALGRYYQGHISGKIANIKFYGNPDKTEFGFLMDKQGVFCRRRLQFTTDALMENKLLNIAFWLDNPPYYDASHGHGVMSFIYLMLLCPILKSRLVPPAIWKSLTGGGARDVGKHFGNIIKGMPQSVVMPFSIFLRRYLARRSLPGVYLLSADNRYALHFHAEQVPTAENYMSLGEDGNKLIINYSYTDEDVDSVIRSHQALDEYLREIQCGELEYICTKNEMEAYIRRSSVDGAHQEGTTRIADSPENGVVDKNLKVFGTNNVYVCSSSIFPTSGQANPTFFLGACAVRLAGYLGQENAN